MSDHSLIETGIDKLISLVKERGRISLPNVSKELGVSKNVIGDWIKFLEEEDLITIEYRLTVPYLVYKKLSKRELITKAKEFKSKREMFLNQASVSLNFIKKEGEKLKGAKTEFDKLKKELGFEIDKVKDELKELEKYDDLKSDLDVKLMDQRKSMEKSLQDYDSKIKDEQRKYTDLIKEIGKEERVLIEEEKDSIALEEQERKLYHQLEIMKDSINNIEDRIKGKDDVIRKYKDNITDLKDFSDKIKKDIESKRKELLPVVEEARSKGKEIEKMQDMILNKLSKQKKDLKESREVTEKFQRFFDQKLKIEELLTRINKDRDELENKLKDAIKKAQAFQITAKDKDVSNNIIELEKIFGDVEKKKSFFEEELRKLKSLLGK